MMRPGLGAEAPFLSVIGFSGVGTTSGRHVQLHLRKRWLWSLQQLCGAICSAMKLFGWSRITRPWCAPRDGLLQRRCCHAFDPSAAIPRGPSRLLCLCCTYSRHGQFHGRCSVSRGAFERISMFCSAQRVSYPLEAGPPSLARRPPVDVLQLESVAASLLENGLASSTRRTHSSGQTSYLSFCSLGRMAPLPTSENILSFCCMACFSGLVSRDHKSVSRSGAPVTYFGGTG